MEFLVTIRQDWPAIRGRADLADLVEKERRVGAQLRAEGILQRIWRCPGKRTNLGLWQAQDATELHAQLVRLPLWPWLNADVLSLARHELDDE